MGKFMLAVGLLALGCGSNDEATPTEKCDDLLTAYFGRVSDCLTQLQCDPGISREDERQACLTAAREKLACGKAKGVGPSYSAYLNAAPTKACSAFGRA